MKRLLGIRPIGENFREENNPWKKSRDTANKESFAQILQNKMKRKTESKEKELNMGEAAILDIGGFPDLVHRNYENFYTKGYKM